MFAIDSIDGTGTGKTELAQKVCQLAGAPLLFDAQIQTELLLKHIVTDNHPRRAIILDNVKVSRFSNAVIESVITSPKIDGHRMYHGPGSRPNYFTFIVTMNGVSMARDLAQRTVRILVKRPATTEGWDERIDRFIEINREAIIADIAALFEQPQTRLKKYSRWGPWERDVLCRLPEADALADLIRERAEEADRDADEASAILEYFGHRLTSLGYDIETDCIHIPTKTCAAWVSDAVGREVTFRQIGGMLRVLVENGSLRGIVNNPSHKHGKGWLWTKIAGDRTAETETLYDLEERVNKEGF